MIKRVVYASPWLISFTLCALLAILPVTGISNYILSVLLIAFIYGSLAASWDLVSGVCGQLVFGHAGLLAVGAYTNVLLITYAGLSTWWAFLFAGLITGIFGLVIGFPSLRIKGPILALATLAFSEVVRIVITNWIDVTGGPTGLSGYPRLAGIDTRVQYYYVGLLFLITSTVALWVLSKSDIGLRFKAIRDDEILAESIGINLTRYKLLAFVVSSLVAGLAGALYANYFTVISPSIAMIDVTVKVISMAVIGGTGSIIGPVIGSFIIQFIAEYFSFLDEYHLLAVGLITMVVILVFPEGLYGVTKIIWRRFCKFVDINPIRSPL